MANPSEALPDIPDERPAFFGYSNVTDYILGITFEIWEQGRVEAILDYYGREIDVYTLEGLTHGAEAMVVGTRATMASFPDRLLLGDDVIWAGNLERGFSSHRITSPMTNRGDTVFAPASGHRIRTMNIADCEITDGRITREWLLRDNVSLVRQLGIDTDEAVRKMAARMDDRLADWLRGEFDRVQLGPRAPHAAVGTAEPDRHNALARRVLENAWVDGDRKSLESAYAPYAVLHRAPVRIRSGRDSILDHYSAWRHALPDAAITVDHVCSQPFSGDGHHVAVRWSVAGSHEGPIGGMAGTGRPVYIVGVTHWRLLGGRIAVEWTVFDELSVMAQSMVGLD